ncbi:MAG: indole-3-glycerol-phosphate synthase TrpC, partial [Pseudomonadota bacterium]
MSDSLQTSLEHKTDEVAAAQATVPVTELMARDKDREPPRGFARALAAPGPYGANIIAEIKRASP